MICDIIRRKTQRKDGIKMWWYIKETIRLWKIGIDELREFFEKKRDIY